MDLAYYYELWRGMMLSADPAVADAVAWWQEFYVKFYMACSSLTGDLPVQMADLPYLARI